MELEPRLLRALVTVAEERHFGRAAARMYVTQPTLTRQVHALEALIGAQLLQRLPTGVVPTEPGRVLLGRARQLLADGERALDETRQVAHGRAGHLSIGFLTSAAEILGPLVRDARERDPGVAFTFTERAWAEQTEGLESGQDDLAFVRDLPATAPWQRRQLGRQNLCIVVPSSHRLAGRKRLTVADLRTLADTPFVASRRWMRGREERWGFTPRVTDDVISLTASFTLVRAGLGVSLMPDSYAHPPVAGVIFIPVQGEISHLELAWEPARPHPPRDRFLAAARG